MKRFIKGFAKLVAVISAIAAIAACIAFICERIEEIKNSDRTFRKLWFKKEVCYA